MAQLTRPARKAMFAAGVWRGSRGVTSDKRNHIAAIPKAASHPLTIRAQRLDPAPLSISFGDITNGRIERGGYIFQIFLPDSSAAPSAEACSA